MTTQASSNMNYLSKLEGFQRFPAGLEWKIWKKLRLIWVAGTALPLMASGGAFLLDGLEYTRSVEQFFYVMVGLVILHYRKRHIEREGESIKQLLEDWCAIIKKRVGNPFPDLPEGISDRNADIWESLIAIADCADEDWSSKARVAAVALVADSVDMVASLGVRLLGDLKLIFGDKESMSTEEILTALRGMPEAPWSDIRGKQIDSRVLASKLNPYGIRPTTIRTGSTTPKGYLRADFIDAWTRYLPSL